jgi:hypothetical protein
MTENENKLKEQIAVHLGNLSEAIIRRMPPGDKIPVHQEACKTLYKFLEYKSELDTSYINDFLEAKIAWSKFRFNQILLGVRGESFGKRHPEYTKVLDDFWKWILKKERIDFLSISPFPDPITKPLVNKEIKKTIKSRLPEYKVDNKAFGAIGFSKPWSFKNNLYILVDTGSYRTSLSFFIGLYDPKFCIDVADFFGDNQSHFSEGYLSIEQIESDTNKAIDLIETIMPHFTDAINRSFESIKT